MFSIIHVTVDDSAAKSSITTYDWSPAFPSVPSINFLIAFLASAESPYFCSFLPTVQS